MLFSFLQRTKNYYAKNKRQIMKQKTKNNAQGFDELLSNDKRTVGSVSWLWIRGASFNLIEGVWAERGRGKSPAVQRSGSRVEQFTRGEK